MGKHEPVSFESAGKEDVTCLSDVDIGNRVDRLGARGSGEDLVLPFYGVDHRVMSTGVADMTGRPANRPVSSLPEWLSTVVTGK